MIERALADLVVVVHLGFVAFVIFGALLVRWRSRVAWIHIPCVAWACLLEFRGWICPLTPLENWLRREAGATGYSDSFTEHYLLPVLYPAGLTTDVQIALGAAVLGLNVVLYATLLRR